MTIIDSPVFDLFDLTNFPAEDMHYFVDRTVAQFWVEVPRPDLLLSVAVAVALVAALEVTP